MGTVIQASELVEGDIIREYRGASPLTPGHAVLRKITGSRVVQTSARYAVLQTEDLQGRQLTGEMSLFGTLSVERLDEIPLAEVVPVLSTLKPGEQLNIVYAEGRFWA